MERLRRASVLLVCAPLALVLGLVPAGAANTVGSSDIIDQSIRKVDIGPDAVGTSEIVTNGVGMSEIASNAVGSAEIAPDSIRRWDIANDAVGGGEIGFNAISGSELQPNSVGTSEIASGAVLADEIATGAVGTAEIADGTVGAADLAADSVDASEIATGAVGTAEIADGTVGAADLAADSVEASEIATGAVGAAEVADDIQIETARTYTAAGSFQLLAADLTLGATAGSADGTNPDFLGATMGNVLGSNLSNDANYVGGVIGHYNISGTNASTYPVGGILAGIGDGTTTADGAVVAYTDGDSAVTTAGAAFKVMNNNSNGASGFEFGVDLQDAAHDGYQPVDEDFYLSAPVRLVRDVVFLVNDAAPTNGTTGAGVAGPGSLYFDTAGKVLYINTNTLASPTWTSVGSQT